GYGVFRVELQDPDDVGVAAPGQQAWLALKEVEPARGEESGLDRLEGDQSVGGRLGCLVDGPPAATAGSPPGFEAGDRDGTHVLRRITPVDRAGCGAAVLDSVDGTGSTPVGVP